VDSRGTVTGKLTLSDGTSTKDAWVILGAASPDWQLQNLDYLYYTKAGADGTFQIPAVRPGTYTLYTVVKGEFGEYRKDGVEVASNRTASLGPLTWQLPEHRKQLWQIGVPNRSADEFRNGQSHQWGLWFNYPVDFPTDVHFIVGKSDYKTDWNYFQPAIHTPGDPKQLKVPVSTKPAVWTVQFPVNESYKGTAYLTIGIAGSVNGSLKADLNGQEIAKYASIPGGPKVDSSFYRVAAAGIYRTLSIPFDASLLKHGDNLLSLSQLSNSNNAGLLYDALRMEVAP
jgi:rhamnogalacturonan endolyase